MPIKAEVKIKSVPQENTLTGVQNKIVRLFTYLEKALSIDDDVIRDFRNTTTPPSPWWLADLPHDAENLFIRPFETESLVTDGTQLSAWLRVEKKNIKAAPTLPKVLEEWINEVNPIDPPKPKEKIDRPIEFKQDQDRLQTFKDFRKNFQEGDQIPPVLQDWVVITPGKLPEAIETKYTEDFWNNHPELQKLLQGYIKNEWSDWPGPNKITLPPFCSPFLGG
jgi:hypothetical protein